MTQLAFEDSRVWGSPDAAASLSAITFACELESLAAGAARNRLFYLASKVGLSADATRMVLDEHELRAKLLHEAHLILRNLNAGKAFCSWDGPEYGIDG